MYVYIQSDPGLLTVGFYAPGGSWHTDSDWSSRDKARERVNYLNGGSVTTVDGFEGSVGQVESEVIQESNGKEPATESDSKPAASERPFFPELLKIKLADMADFMREKLQEGWKPANRVVVARNLESIFAPDTCPEKNSRGFTRWIFGWEDIRNALPCQVLALARWLDVKSEYDGGPWVLSSIAEKEAKGVVSLILEEEAES